MDSCPRSLDNMQLERELPHCLSAKEGVWAWSTTNGLKLQPLSGQEEKWRKEGRREQTHQYLKALENEPIFPLPLKLRPKSTISTSELQIIKTFSLPLSPSSAWHRKPVVLISSQKWSWNFTNSTPHGKQTRHAITTHLWLINHLQSLMHPEIWT